MFKEMYNIYRDQLKEKNGKSASQLFDNENKAFNYKWTDTELINKIETMFSWKREGSKEKVKNERELNEMLSTLVFKGEALSIEERRIRENREKEANEKIKAEIEAAENRIKFSILSSDNIENLELLKSKYPVDKRLYEQSIKLQEEQKSKIIEEGENPHKIYNTKIIDDVNNCNNELELPSPFYEAVRKLKDNEKGKRKKNFTWIEYEYKHPGTFREFVFVDKVTGTNDYQITQIEKRKMAWSCCMNDNKSSKGCQRKTIDRLKWNLESV